MAVTISSKEVKLYTDNQILWKLLTQIQFTKKRIQNLNLFISDLKNLNKWILFSLGLSLGIGMNIHYQMTGLIIVPIIIYS